MLESIKRRTSSVNGASITTLALKCDDSDGTIVLFPGDISDTREEMSRSQVKRQYVKYCIEALMETLSARFPTYDILSFNCEVQEDLFVSYAPLTRGNTFNNVLQCLGTDYSTPLIFVGFSRGSFALGAILKSINKDNFDEFLKVKSMVWADGNHFPRSSRQLIPHGPEYLKHCCFVIQSTPRQIYDANRTWIRRERDEFLRILGENKLHFIDEVYFKDEEPSLDIHFKILEVCRICAIK